MTKIIVGEHTISIEKNGEIVPANPLEVAATIGTIKGIALAAEEHATDYFTGGAIKAFEQGEIGGYLVNWGSPAQRDSTGEFFTPNTEYRLDYYQSRPILFHHGLGEADSVKIGEIYELIKDERGIYARGRLYLDDTNPDVRSYAQRAWQDVKRDKLFWSSGSISHLVEKTDKGEITKWPIVEGSLTPTPAEKVRTKVDALKALWKQQLDDTAIAPVESATKEDAETVALSTDKSFQSYRQLSLRKAIKMIDQAMIDALMEKGLSAEQVLAVIGTLGEAASPEAPDDGMMAEEDMPNEEDPMRSEETPLNGKASESEVMKAIAQLKKQNEAMAKQITSMKTAPATEQIEGRSDAKKSQGLANVRVTSKWDGLAWEDMIFVKTLLDGASKYRGGQGWQPDKPEVFYRALAAKMDKAGRDGQTFSDVAIKAINAIKTDDLNYSTQTSFGDEFVPDLWRSQLWEKPRLDNPVFREMQTVEMPSNPYNIPAEDADPTIFAVAETKNENQLGQNDSNAAIPDTKVGTNKVQITAGKLAARINISAELVEDSIIPVAAHWRFKAVRAMEDARDFVILSADATTGSSNINNDGSSIGATNKALYGGGDGLLHLPLVTDTTLGVSMANVSPTLAKIREARTKLNSQILADFANLVYFCDPLTSVALSSLDEFVDAGINGRESTVNTGYIGQIDSIPVYVSAQMSLATTTGVVSATAGSNTQGRLLLIHRPSWYVGFRRDINANLAFQPEHDAWVLVVSMRMGITRRADDVASLLYNIAV